MKHLRMLAKELLRWGDREPSVEAILWHGSTARGDSGPTSDLDTVVLHTDDKSSWDMFQSLLCFLDGRVRFSSVLDGRNEAAVWVHDSLTKIDLHFGRDPEEFAWLADSEDVPNPRLVVGLDKHNRCDEIVARASAELERSVPDLLNEEIEKFLYGFEAASSAHRRSDGYQFYFHYNLALHRLARIIELLRGEPIYLFLPKLLLPKRMPLSEQKMWRGLRGSIYLPEANDLKCRLIERFLDALQDARARCNVVRDCEEVQVFLQTILRRDLFFNVRDFADAFGDRVRTRVLFRASTLTRWRDEPALDEWLRTNNIRRIIDLRKREEIEAAAGQYLPESLVGIDYLHVPMGGPPLRPDLPPSSPEAGVAYIEMFKAEHAAIACALKHLASEWDGAAVVHCYAGKDRTGVFCAALALLLDLPEEDIVADYVLSGQGVTEQAIQRFMEWFRRSEGRELLDAAGLDENTVASLRARILSQ